MEKDIINTKEYIRIEHISKKVKNKQIINDVSLNIQEGEIFGLVGVNGAGKTTIMRILTGLIYPTDGCVYIDGKNVYQNEKVLANVGAIIEGPDLYKHLSGYMNLKLAANMYKYISEERILEVASMLGIKDRLKDKVKTYSLGMRQRLAIATALLNNPSLLVFDEPLNGLDPQGVREVRNIMKELAHEKNVTIIISSHILSEMELVCDRFGIIDKGFLTEVKEMKSSEYANNMWEFTFMNGCNMTQLENITKKMSIEIVSMEAGKLIVKMKDEEKAEFIKKIVEEDFCIYSIVPVRVGLEEYFINKVGEKE